MWRLVANGAIPQAQAPLVLEALSAHHHHAASKERHAMLQSRADRRRKAKVTEKKVAARRRSGSGTSILNRMRSSLHQSTAEVDHHAQLVELARTPPMSPTPASSLLERSMPSFGGSEPASPSPPPGDQDDGARGGSESRDRSVDPECNWLERAFFVAPQPVFDGSRRNAEAINAYGLDLGELLNDPDPDSLDHDDDALDVLVGATPFLTRIITAFVRLKTPVVIGDFSEEGYRTRHIFVCLGPTGEGDEVWEIGRSFAILMSQEKWGERVDCAADGAEIGAIIEEFMDKAVIVPQLGEQLDSIKRLESEKNVGVDLERGSDGGSGGGDHGGDARRPSALSVDTGGRGGVGHPVPAPPIPLPTARGSQASQFFGDGHHAVDTGKCATPTDIAVAIPMHLNGAQRRIRAARELREASQRARATHEAKGAALVLSTMQLEADYHPDTTMPIWTRKTRLHVGLVALFSLAIIAIFLAWLGPIYAAELAAHTGTYHRTHFFSETAEGSHLGALSRGHPLTVVFSSGDLAEAAVFDVKIIAQAGPAHGHAAAKVHPGVPSIPFNTTVEAMLYAFEDPNAGDDHGSDDNHGIDYHGIDHHGDDDDSSFPKDADHARPCLGHALKLAVGEATESELLAVVVLADEAGQVEATDAAAGSASGARRKRCSLWHGGYWEVTTNSAAPLAVMFEASPLGEAASYRVLLSGLLLLLFYACIMADLVHRTLAAMCGSFAALVLLATTTEYHAGMGAALVWMDEGTLALLFGMMILVALISTTGVFEWLAIRALDASKGDLRLLLVLLCLSCGVLSAFIDNVTTMLLFAPVTIELAGIIGVDCVPLLISEVLFSNICGTATMVGDSPNIIIGNLLSEHVSFLDFIVNLMPVIALCVWPILAFLKWFYRDFLAQPMANFNIAELRKKYEIHNPVLLAKSGLILGAVLVLFFLHPVHHVDTSWVACVGALGLMIVATPHELHHVFTHVEWDTLLFFAALFVMIEAMAMMGLIRAIGSALAAFIAAAPVESRLRVALTVILWTSATVSGLLDNIPYTATMVPVVRILSEHPDLDLPLKPLVWALSLGACLGGNMTLVGSSANLVTVGAAEQSGKHIGFGGFMTIGTPVTFITVTICTGYCILVYDVWGLGH